MKTVIKAIAAGLVGFAAIGITAASADRGDRHDDRRDRNGVSFSIVISDQDGYYDNRRNRHYDNRRYRNYDNGYRSRGNRVVSRRVLDTRFRARIVVKEEIVHRRRGARLICTVTPRGPEADYVPYRRLKRVARNHCSPRARVKIYA